METTLKRLLLEPPEGGDGALFKSQRAIAEAISELASSRYSGKGHLLGPTLNHVLNARRPCPRPLEDGIVMVAKQAAASSGAGSREIDQLESELREAIAVARTRARDPSTGGLSADVQEIIERQGDAAVVVIVNARPQELRGHPATPLLSKVTLEALVGGAHYFFLVESEVAAKTQWLQLREQAARRGDQNLAEFRKWVDSDQLRIGFVPSDRHWLPVVALDPDDERRCSVYVWDWWPEHGRIHDSVAQLGPETTNAWIREFYRPMIAEDGFAHWVAFQT